jgi:hypothetical protein
MQDVPEADSQLKLKIAGYGEMAVVTGGMRAIWLCRPGHRNTKLTEFKGFCIV